MSSPSLGPGELSPSHEDGRRSTPLPHGLFGRAGGRGDGAGGRNDEQMRQDANLFLSGISLTGCGRDEQAEAADTDLGAEVDLQSSQNVGQKPTRVAYFGQVQAAFLNQSRVNLIARDGGHPWASFSVIAYNKSVKKTRKKSTMNTSALQVECVTAARNGRDRKVAKSYGDLLTSSAQRHDATFFDNSQTGQGKHQKLLTMQGYSVSLLLYVKPADLKRDLNERFAEMHPDIDLTLSKWRSLKRDLMEMGVESCEMEVASVAYGHFYFDQLVKERLISKANRKVCAATCLVLAVKFIQGNHTVANCLQRFYRVVADRWHISQDDVLAHEIPIWKALKFDLHVMPNIIHMYRDNILQQLPDNETGA